MQKLADFILFKLFRWEILGNSNLPKKCIVIVAPHTHWLDFFIAIVIRKVIKQQINFIGKKELFKFPFGLFFRWVGGTPVDRGSKTKSVDLIAEIFNNKSEFRLGISPEGTRKKVLRWKTGFYYIARKASVPIVSATLNFKEKNIKFSDPFFTTENIEDDFKNLRSFFKEKKKKIEEYS